MYQRVAERLERERQEPAPAPAPAPPWPLQDDAVDGAAVPPAETEEHTRERQAVRAVWRRLREADLPREQYATALRILHGSIYVRAFLCHIHVLPPGEACCSHAACAGLAVPPLEGLTHAFVECPAVAPAAAWVCRVFAAASGGAPPPVCPRVLLADEPSVWAPPPDLRHMWAHLRLSYLHAVWQLRARRDLAGQPFGPAAVCGAVVAAVRAAIQRDWTRATRDMRHLSGT